MALTEGNINYAFWIH